MTHPIFEKILKLEEKKERDKYTDEEVIIHNFKYAEVIALIKEEKMAEEDFINFFQDLLIAQLAIGTAKLTLEGGLGENTVEADFDSLKKILELLLLTQELRKAP
jgi:hypothetical protein